MNCGSGPVTVSPPPFLETGTGWFVDGRGLSSERSRGGPGVPASAWVTHELKRRPSTKLACCRSSRPRLMRGERPDLERHPPRGTSRALASAKVEAQPEITVLLSNGMKLKAEVKSSARCSCSTTPASRCPTRGATWRCPVADGVYPANRALEARPADRRPRAIPASRASCSPTSSSAERLARGGGHNGAVSVNKDHRPEISCRTDGFGRPPATAAAGVGRCRLVADLRGLVDRPSTRRAFCRERAFRLRSSWESTTPGAGMCTVGRGRAREPDRRVDAVATRSSAGRAPSRATACRRCRAGAAG